MSPWVLAQNQRVKREEKEEIQTRLHKMAADRARVAPSHPSPQQTAIYPKCRQGKPPKYLPSYWSMKFAKGQGRNTSPGDAQAEIPALGMRTAELEHRVNTTVSNLHSMDRQLGDLEMLVEDQANRSWRNNLRIRGLPEAPNEGSLVDKMAHYFKHLLPDIPEEKWVIDRAHCTPKEQRDPCHWIL
ncbi:Hypothetical predicted protein [Pelobates cultripes]|uniref:Uncharacterized protein n=1 Tax=Pelobates cultripes TaxID=61616 RepID=A0AAD1VXL2_PELCU|nr:Hypothetical predicted protein [Pelobates cultripes]